MMDKYRMDVRHLFLFKLTLPLVFVLTTSIDEAQDKMQVRELLIVKDRLC